MLCQQSNSGRVKIACATNHPFVVEATISQQRVDFEGVGVGAVEDSFGRVGLFLVAADIGGHQCGIHTPQTLIVGSEPVGKIQEIIRGKSVSSTGVLEEE